MLGENEKKFIENLINHVANVAKAQEYIKENYGVTSYYDEETETLHLVGDQINEGLNLASAKDYVRNQFDEVMLNVVLGI
jgi:hypothetical protein